MTGIFYGSTTGSTEAVAQDIAKQLGIAFYDKELLLDSVFNAEDAARYDEKPVHLLWSRRIGENFNAPEDALAHETFDYIQKLAASRSSCSAAARTSSCAAIRTPCTCSSPANPTRSVSGS